MTSAFKYSEEQNPPFSCIAVSNFFVDKGYKCRSSLKHFQLQKRIDFAHCNIIFDKKCSDFDESPQAWGKGPVFAGLYHRLKYFGNSCIDVPIDLAFQLFPLIKNDYVINEMEYIFSKSKYHSANELSDITHQSGRAWEKCYDPDNPLYNKTITTEDILEYESRY